MGFATKYLEKHQFSKIDIPRVPSKSGLLKYIVVIPAFCEPEIFSTLNSICQATPIKPGIEVFILVNYAESCTPEIKTENLDLHNSLLKWANQNKSKINFTPLLYKNLPKKHAGAGLARKILMDSACKHFDALSNPDGIIISLDADTLVPENYFTGIDKTTTLYPDSDCFILNFAHPTKGNAYSDEVYNAIALYELHLRYYRQILKTINYPYYEYTIGSCFAVKAKTYIKVGGMSRRKAGEDFYFLHKVFPNSNTTFLKDVIVCPSPRPSWRVPFGTGPAIKKILDKDSAELKTYHPQCFYELEKFIAIVPKLINLSLTDCEKEILKIPESIKSYLFENQVMQKIEEIRNNSASEKTFLKRFYNWFDAFFVLKFLNHSRDHFFESIDVMKAVNDILGTREENVFLLLENLRDLDR